MLDDHALDSLPDSITVKSATGSKAMLGQGGLLSPNGRLLFKGTLFHLEVGSPSCLSPRSGSAEVISARSEPLSALAFFVAVSEVGC